jgi:hypothetical protein
MMQDDAVVHVVMDRDGMQMYAFEDHDLARRLLAEVERLTERPGDFRFFGGVRVKRDLASALQWYEQAER